MKRLYVPILLMILLAGCAGSGKPKTAEAFIERGISFALQAEYGKAIEDFSEAIRLSPNMGMAYILRGRAYYASVSNVTDTADNFSSVRIVSNGGRPSPKQTAAFDLAAADFTQAIRFNPNYAKTYIERGNTYDEKGDYEKAIADYDKVIDLEPKSAEAYINRGLSYFYRNAVDRSFADYSQAIQLDPNDTRAYINRGIAYYSGSDFDSAITDFSKAINLDSGNATAYYYRGTTYFTVGNFEQAITDYETSLRLNPNNPSAGKYLDEARKAQAR